MTILHHILSCGCYHNDRIGVLVISLFFFLACAVLAPFAVWAYYLGPNPEGELLGIVFGSVIVVCGAIAFSAYAYDKLPNRLAKVSLWLLVVLYCCARIVRSALHFVTIPLISTDIVLVIVFGIYSGLNIPPVPISVTQTRHYSRFGDYVFFDGDVLVNYTKCGLVLPSRQTYWAIFAVAPLVPSIEKFYNGNDTSIPAFVITPNVDLPCNVHQSVMWQEAIRQASESGFSDSKVAAFIRESYKDMDITNDAPKNVLEWKYVVQKKNQARTNAFITLYVIVGVLSGTYLTTLTVFMGKYIKGECCSSVE